MSAYQIVVCQGPRCCARGRPAELLNHLAALRAERGMHHVFLAGYACLGRCAGGPNLVVRKLPDGSPDPGSPGLYDLDGGLCYFAADRGLLERILEQHCGRHAPIEGRCMAY